MKDVVMDPRMRMCVVGGQCVFPIIAASGGIAACSIAYLLSGELTGEDLGRAGPTKHSRGYSWGIHLEYGHTLSNDRLNEEIEKFAKYLDKETSCAEQVQKTGNSTATANS